MRAVPPLAVLLLCTAGAGATPLTGKLAGQEFTAAKIVFYDQPSYWRLAFRDGGSADCGHDTGSGGRYLEITPRQLGVRIEVGKPMTEAGVSVLWSRPSYKDPRGIHAFEVTITAIDTAAARVTGTLQFRADGGSELSGPFEARYCGSREVAVAEQQPVHGVAWSLDAAPKQLPGKPVQGWFLGQPFTPVFVSLAGYEQTREEVKRNGWKIKFPPIITFFADKPADACIDHLQAKGDRFVAIIDPDRPLRAGAGYDGELERRHGAGTYFGQADTPRMLFGTQKGRLKVRLDKVDKKKRIVKGRVYLAVDDIGKSLLVGAFTATYCKDPTGA